MVTFKLPEGTLHYYRNTVFNFIAWTQHEHYSLFVQCTHIIPHKFRVRVRVWSSFVLGIIIGLMVVGDQAFTLPRLIVANDVTMIFNALQTLTYKFPCVMYHARHSHETEEQSSKLGNRKYTLLFLSTIFRASRMTS